MTCYSLLVEPEDVNQEVELLKAQGTTRVNRSFVQQKLHRLAYDHLNYDELATATGEEGEPWETLDYQPERPVWIEAQERIVDWALDQTQYVQSVINQFLEDPIENYELTIQALIEAKIIKPELEEGESIVPCSSQPSVTYVSILKKRLKARPASKEDLIQEMSHYPINRPATTVRQFLRRHKAHLLEEDGMFRWVA